MKLFRMMLRNIHKKILVNEARLKRSPERSLSIKLYTVHNIFMMDEKLLISNLRMYDIINSHTGGWFL